MSAVGLVISQVATVVQTLVLGRLLGPHEVGVFVAGSVMIGFLGVVAEGSLSQALIHRKTDVEDAANTVLVVTFGTGLLGSLALLAASPLIGDTVPQFAGRSGRGRDIRTDGASCVCERPGCADEARISVQTTDDYHAGDLDHVRGCLDRVRHPGIRRVGNGHRVVRINHHHDCAELVDGEMAPVPRPILVPHLA